MDDKGKEQGNAIPTPPNKKKITFQTLHSRLKATLVSSSTLLYHFLHQYNYKRLEKINRTSSQYIT